MPATIQPGATFKDNLAHMPSIDGLLRIDLLDAQGTPVAGIENAPGKQGSLAVYHYLAQRHDLLDATAAQDGLDLFAEHTEDARKRPGAHPNIDRLLAIVAGADPLRIACIPASAG